MIAWLYTEQADARTDGPFFKLGDAMDSPLWEHPRSCLWMVEHTPRGWNYEHVKWCGDHWLTTSRGFRPLEPFSPETIAGTVAAFAGGRGPSLVHPQRN